MFIKLPKDVEMILTTLHNNGYEAYVVGGCVRDALLMKTPDDWDITTSAKPHEVKKLFPRTFDTGIQHGTVTVRVNHTNYEVTTFRIEDDYVDGRHPSSVAFTNLLSEDLKRRDFTINAMAYNSTVGLVDLFDGRHDLEHKIIRCVGNAKERFEEDALRILRALRFSAQLHFQIEANTLIAIKECATLLTKISMERVNVELTKLLISNHPEYIQLLYDTGVSKVILPEFDIMMETMQCNPHHCYSVGKHTIETLKHVPNDPILRYSMLFHDLGKPNKKTTDDKGIDHFYGHQKESAIIAHKIMRRLKFDSHSMQLIERYVEHHDCRMEPTLRNVRRNVAHIGKDLFPNFFLIQRADILAQSDYLRDKKLETLSLVETIYKTIIEEEHCLSIKDLKINGKDLLDLGFTAGPRIGQILQSLLNEVLENPEMNQHDTLITYCQEHFM